MDHNQLRIKIIDFSVEKDRRAYRNIVSLKEFHNPYYHIEYLLRHQTDANKLIVFLLWQKESCVAILPVILNPIPNTEYWDAISPYGYSGPLFKGGLDEKSIHTFWNKIDQWYSKNQIVTEFIRFSLNKNHKHYSGECFNTLSNVCGTIKNNVEQQWESFGRKVRNNYRKALSFGLSFKLFDQKNLTKAVIDEFYHIYYETMLRNNASKFLFFSADFFHHLVLENKQDFTIAMVYLNNRAISTELHIHYKDSIYAFLGGTDSDFFHTRPNDYLRVEFIKWAIVNNKGKYILGGGIKNNDGLYKSKKALFPKDDDCIFYTGRKVINKAVYNSLVEDAIQKRGISEDDSYFPLYRKP